MLSLFGSNSSEAYYRQLCRCLRTRLIRCDSSIIPNSVLEVKYKIPDVSSIKANYYDEHLFVYILGKGIKENYNIDSHRNLLLNLWTNKEECKDHHPNILMISPNNIVFAKVLFDFVKDPCYRKDLIKEAMETLKGDVIVKKNVENELLSMIRKMNNVITEYMSKSLILHVYVPFEKKMNPIGDLLCSALNISQKYYELKYYELETSEEIDNIRIPQIYETKTAKDIEKKGLKTKSINIKYAGLEDLLDKFMDILWDEWKEENDSAMVDTDMFKEFASHINSKFNYNAYTIDFLTRDQAAKDSIFPNEFTVNEVPTHEEIFNEIGTLIKETDAMKVDQKGDEVDSDGEERIIT